MHLYNVTHSMILPVRVCPNTVSTPHFVLSHNVPQAKCAWVWGEQTEYLTTLHLSNVYDTVTW